MAGMGYFALLLALVASIYSVVAFSFGAANSARKSLFTAFGLVTASVVILTTALVAHDFRIEYVASYTSRDMSLPYLISALWAGNAGSLLFWAWLLSLFSTIAALRWRHDKKEMTYAAAVMMVTEAFFLVLLIWPQNPFKTLPSTPGDGLGMNPLLENPAMIIHPPLLLAGYVALTVPFAMAISALLSNQLNNDWLNRARGWALLAWLFLGVGNLIGAWWAYVELGWGGYWAWDPVENAGLMPWLVATAFLHSISGQRRTDVFKAWSIGLVMLAFGLTIFGTFLTRSDLLRSVHTFGEVGVGPFFLVFLFLIIAGSVGLVTYRRKELASSTSVESLISKEASFLLNNLLLLAATFAIFVGTMFPAISEAISGSQVELQQSFFNQVNTPVFLTIVLLSGVCIFVGWRRIRVSGRDLIFPLALSLLVVLALLLFGISEWYALTAFGICGFVISATLFRWSRELTARRRTKTDEPRRTSLNFMWANKNRYGSYIVHIAIVVIAIGIVGSSVYDVSKEATLKPGESMNTGGYTVTYEKLDFQGDSNKMVFTARLTVRNGDRFICSLAPEKSLHRNFEQPVTEVAIRSTPVEDLYVILVGWDNAFAAAFKVLVNPLVFWIWVGGGLLVVGGLICFLPQTAKTAQPDKRKHRQPGL